MLVYVNLCDLLFSIEVTNNYSLKWSLPDNEKIIRMLCDDFQFTDKRVEIGLEKFLNIDHMMKQKTLF